MLRGLTPGWYRSRLHVERLLSGNLEDSIGLQEPDTGKIWMTAVLHR